MNEDKYLMYALAAVAAGGIFVWSGVPATFLLVLICPVMMSFMMRGMGGMGSNNDSKSDDQDASKRSDASKPDGSHERINQPSSCKGGGSARAVVQTTSHSHVRLLDGYP